MTDSFAEKSSPLDLDASLVERQDARAAAKDRHAPDPACYGAVAKMSAGAAEAA